MQIGKYGHRKKEGGGDTRGKKQIPGKKKKEIRQGEKKEKESGEKCRKDEKQFLGKTGWGRMLDHERKSNRNKVFTHATQEAKGNVRRQREGEGTTDGGEGSQKDNKRRKRSRISWKKKRGVWRKKSKRIKKSERLEGKGAKEGGQARTSRPRSRRRLSRKRTQKKKETQLNASSGRPKKKRKVAKGGNQEGGGKMKFGIDTKTNRKKGRGRTSHEDLIGAIQVIEGTSDRRKKEASSKNGKPGKKTNDLEGGA